MVNGRTISHDNDGVHEIGEISAFVDTNADYGSNFYYLIVYNK